MSTVTIRLEKSLKDELDSLKAFNRESYSDVIKRLLNVLEDSELDDREITQIEKSLDDIKHGRVLSLKDAEKEWGI